MVNSNPTLLFSTAPFFRQPLKQAFRAIADAGFDAVEVMVTQDPATRHPDRLAELAREFGLRVEAIHAPFLLVTRRVWGPDPITKIDRAIELAGGVGASLVVVHPPFRWQRDYRRWIAERLRDVTAESGVTVAVENMFPLRLPGAPSMRFHSESARADTEGTPHLVLDTSHASATSICRTTPVAGGTRICPWGGMASSPSRDSSQIWRTATGERSRWSSTSGRGWRTPRHFTSCSSSSVPTARIGS
jgi:hypothetical protein